MMILPVSGLGYQCRRNVAFGEVDHGFGPPTNVKESLGLFETKNSTDARNKRRLFAVLNDLGLDTIPGEISREKIAKALVSMRITR